MAVSRRGGPEQGADSGTGSSGLNDAYWSYRSIEYVPLGPPLEHSLFDRGAGELERLSTSAVSSMAADEPDEEALRRRAEAAQERLNSLSSVRNAPHPGASR